MGFYVVEVEDGGVDVGGAAGFEVGGDGGEAVGVAGDEEDAGALFGPDAGGGLGDAGGCAEDEDFAGGGLGLVGHSGCPLGWVKSGTQSTQRKNAEDAAVGSGFPLGFVVEERIPSLRYGKTNVGAGDGHYWMTRSQKLLVRRGSLKRAKWCHWG